MINQDIYSKLTPSAKDALNEIAEEYKEILLENAYKIAQDRKTSDKEISLSDIFEAKKPALNQIEPNKLEYRRKKVTVMLTLSGVIYTIAGLVIYLYQNKKLFAENNIGLIIALVGIGFTFFVSFYSQIFQRVRLIRSYNKSYSDSSLKSYLIVQKWQLIEKLAKKGMSNNDTGEKYDSVGYLIRFLSHKIANDETEFLKIKELLKVRNNIVHQGYNPDEKQLDDLLSFSDDLIKRLETGLDQDLPNTKTLKVIKATYGTPKNSIDATEALNQLINNNELEFVANNEIVGDPDFGTPKNLEITYKIGNSTKTEIFQEGAKVVINRLESVNK